MPEQETPAAPQPSRWARKLPPGRSRVAWRGGGVALLLVLLGITAAVAGPSGRGSAGGSRPVSGPGDLSGDPSGAASGPGSAGSSAFAAPPTGPTVGTAKGSGSAQGGPGSAASAGPAPLTHPSTRLAPAPARAGAATVLEADDSHYRQELTVGERLLGTPGFAAWSARTLADPADRSDTARADAEFTGSDQPPALIPWRADNGEGVAAVQQFARDGADGASIATRTDAGNALTYLADADRLAQQVSAGD